MNNSIDENADLRASNVRSSKTSDMDTTVYARKEGTYTRYVWKDDGYYVIADYESGGIRYKTRSLTSPPLDNYMKCTGLPVAIKEAINADE